MPHYKDNTPARLGDRVRGPNQSIGKVVEGIIVSLTRGATTCNVQVAYPVVIQPNGVSDVLPVVMMQTGYANVIDLELVEPTPITPVVAAIVVP